MAEHGQPIHAVTVIGAGQHGRAFARRCATAGFSVVLEDVLSSKLRKAHEELSVDDGGLLGDVRFAGSVEEAVRDADLVIDFVPDELESKLEIFSMVDRMAPPRTILFTPSLLSISDLASCTYRADRCVAVLPFQNDDALSLVMADATSEDTEARVSAWLRALGFAVQTQRDVVQRT